MAHVPSVAGSLWHKTGMLVLLLFYTVSITSGTEEAPSGMADGFARQLEAKIRALENDPRKDDPRQAQLLGLFQQTLEMVKKSASIKARIEHLEALQFRSGKLQMSEPNPLAEEPGFEPPAHATARQLEQLLDRVRVEGETLHRELDTIQAKIKAGREHRANLPQLLAEARTNLNQLKTEFSPNSDLAERDELALAQATQNQAKLGSAGLRVRLYELELATFDQVERQSLAELEITEERAASARKKIRVVQEALTAQRHTEAQEAVRQAQADIEMAAHIHPAFRRIAQENAGWLEQNSGPEGLAWKLERATTDLESLALEVNQLQQEFAALTERVSATGFSNSVGMMLRSKRSLLPDAWTHRNNLRTREALLSQIQINILDLEQHQVKNTTIEDQAKELFDSLDVSLCGVSQEEALAFLRSLMHTREHNRLELLRTSHRYVEKLNDLNAKEQELVSAGQQFSDYIDEHILWIRNLEPISGEDAVTTWKTVRGELASGWFTLLWNRGIGSVKTHPVSNLAFGLMVVLLWLERRYLRRRIQSSFRGDGEPAFTPGKLVLALLFTFLNAALWPGALWFLARQIELSSNVSGMERLLGAGLCELVTPLFILSLWREIAIPGGIGEQFPGWSGKALTRFQSLLKWSTWVLPLLFFLYGAVNWWAGESENQIPLRLTFLMLTGGLTPLVWSLTGACHALVPAEEKAGSTSWKILGHRVWRWVLVAVPPLLGGIAVVGYAFAAIHLFERIVTLAAIAGTLVILHKVRLVVLSRLSMVKESVPGTPAGTEISESTQETLGQNLETALRVASLALGIGLAAHLWWTWVDVFPAFKTLETVQLWTYPVEVKEAVSNQAGVTQPRVVTKLTATTLADLCAALLIAVISLTAAKIIPRFLEVMVFLRLPFDQGGRYALKAVTHYLLIVAGAIMTFGKLGISWSTLQWLAAAVTFGLGFGLQEIFGNFVSGLIILFEQPVRVGDIVTVNGVMGRVSRIQIRATTITDFDRQQVIIPNKTFLTGQISNWSLADSNRITLEIGVAYGSDTGLVEKLLYAAAQENPHVLQHPAPRVVFYGFAHSTLNFKLQAHIPNRDVYWDAVHRLYNTINRTFQEAGVEIPFPQQEVHLSSTLAIFDL
ncbi:MAG: mechanosensitive ion channel [Blastocatellia bacterium]|nr:mechanosensitive ion channel [Blastocatellia bacterium]